MVRGKLNCPYSYFQLGHESKWGTLESTIHLFPALEYHWAHCNGNLQNGTLAIRKRECGSPCANLFPGSNLHTGRLQLTRAHVSHNVLDMSEHTVNSMASKSKLDKHSTDMEFGARISVRVRKVWFTNICDKPCLSNVLSISLPLMGLYRSSDPMVQKFN